MGSEFSKRFRTHVKTGLFKNSDILAVYKAATDLAMLILFKDPLNKVDLNKPITLDSSSPNTLLPLGDLALDLAENHPELAAQRTSSLIRSVAARREVAPASTRELYLHLTHFAGWVQNAIAAGTREQHWATVHAIDNFVWGVTKSDRVQIFKAEKAVIPTNFPSSSQLNLPLELR